MECQRADGLLQALSQGDWRHLAPMLLPLALLPVLLHALSRLGGWAALAERYPATGEAPRPRCRFGHAIFRRWCGYNGCLIVSADQTGLSLSLWPVFSIGHAPIFIPWSEVREIRRVAMWGRPIYRIITARAPEVDFALHGRAWEFIRPHVEAAGVKVIG
ncbi:MAG: hypothetical protein NTY77_00055 [Elusimicrobia bacterium]|nr:hypothetical protein [Elusimicrobiota bacterium]